MRKLRRISVALMLSLAMLLNSQNALLSFATTQENSTSTQQIVLEEEKEPAQSDSEDGQTDGEQTEGEQTDGEQTEGEQTDGEQTDGEQTDGEQTDGEQTDGEQTDGEQTEGEQTEGEQTDGEQTDGEQTEGEQTEGEQTEGEQTEGEQTEGNTAWTPALMSGLSVNDRTKDYPQQSDSVEVEVTKEGSNVKLVYTIKEGASGDLVLNFDQIMEAYVGEFQYPGQADTFTLEIHNQSGKTYRYKQGSFDLSTMDLSGMEGCGAVGFDGQSLPLSYVSGMVTNDALRELFGSGVDLTLENYLTLYEKLGEKDYTSLTAYFVDYYNQKYGTSYTDFREMIDNSPTIYGQIQKGNGNSISMTKQEADQYQAEHPEIMNWAYVVSEDGDNLKIQFKWPEAELQSAGYDGFYGTLFSFAFGSDVDNLQPNKDHTSCHVRGVGDYMTDASLKSQTDAYFAQGGELATGGTMTYNGKWALDGPCTVNDYFNYEFGFYGSFVLEEVNNTPIPPNPPTWDHSKSKTATNLDANFQSTVTLSLPSAQYELVSDVVFVLDKSTSPQVEQDALDMLSQLQQQVADTGAKVKVGVVIFNKTANTSGWFDLTTQYDQIEQAITAKISSGTNTHAGLMAGKALLDSDTEVDPSRKYMIFVSDGITYMFDEPAQAINSQQVTNGEYAVMADPYCWGLRHYKEGGDNFIPTNWESYLSDVGAHLSEVAEYIQTYDSMSDDIHIPRGDTTLPTTVDVALYKTNDLYRQMQQAGYHCYAIQAEAGAAATYPWGPAYMNYLADGQEVTFDQIQNDIYYLLDAGSEVQDYIGEGTDNLGNDYDFQFVNDLSKLKLTVGGVELDKHEIEENVYGFGHRDGEYQFILSYEPNDAGGELLRWEIYVPVSNFNPVQLSYNVQLTNPQTTDGTYGQYDEDGSEQYDSLYTNVSATLYPVDSNGVAGEPEEFAKPTVSYAVATATITPADVTIYVGGDSYTGTVGDAGQTAGTNNGFPVPGFTITGIADFDASKATLTYDDGEDDVRSWKIVPYDDVEDATHGIYRFEPVGTGAAVRMQFEKVDSNGEGTGEFVTEDDFTIDNHLDQDLIMEVYGEGVDAGYVSLEYDGASYQIATDTGMLKVRTATEDAEYGDLEDGVVTGEPSLTAPQDTTYYINDKEVQVANTEGIALLFDDIVENNDVDGVSNTDLLEQRVDKELGTESTTRQYEPKYLDLVDRNNGNVWVAADQDVTVYWPLPEGTTKNTQFSLFHFEGMHREMGVDEVADDILNTPLVEDMSDEIQVTDTHIVFKISRAGFSPFVLTWDTKAPTPNPDPDPDPKPEDKPSDRPTRGDNHELGNTVQTIVREETPDKETPTTPTIPTETQPDKHNPSTGDAGSVMLAMSAAGISLAAALMLVKKHR